MHPGKPMINTRNSVLYTEIDTYHALYPIIDVAHMFKHKDTHAAGIPPMQEMSNSVHFSPISAVACGAITLLLSTVVYMQKTDVPEYLSWSVQ